MIGPFYLIMPENSPLRCKFLRPTLRDDWASGRAPEGREHAFRNRGEGPMRILWIYGASRVTRTFAETGETVEHLSEQDLMA